MLYFAHDTHSHDLVTEVTQHGASPVLLFCLIGFVVIIAGLAYYFSKDASSVTNHKQSYKR